MRYRSLLPAATLAAVLGLAPAAWAQIGIGVSITVAPPALPVYVQPPVPAVGYLWVPGYWAWADGGYYWVPGTWVEPPQPGLLWTPGYWGWENGVYFWHVGYWGAHVGFYGGVHYGFGYNGVGYLGGYWSHGAFFYNRAVNRIPVGVHIANVYRQPVPAVNVHISFNGGVGGIQAHATAAELAAARGPHLMPVAAQRREEQLAGRNPALRFANNHGRPTIAATAHAGRFSGAGVVGARGAPAIRANIAHHGAGPGLVRRSAEQSRARQEGGPQGRNVQERAQPEHAPDERAQQQHARPGQHAAPARSPAGREGRAPERKDQQPQR